MSDPEERPLFDDVYPSSPPINEYEAEITFRFRGEDALKVREAMSAAILKQNGEALRAEQSGDS